ncbi:MAG: BtpA/SgcQ family protein [Candidatus Hodarchaeota archaeon]
MPKSPLNLSIKPLIGMVHVPPFNNSYSSSDSFDNIIEYSIQDAIALEKAGFDAVLIENFHDTPFPKYRLDDTRLLLMSSLIRKIVDKVNIPCGVNILRNACTQALIMATVNHGSFIRCNIYEGAYVTDQGIIESVASEVQQKYKEIGSNVKILADIHVKHASPIGDFTLEEAAINAMKRAGADAVIVSGRSTGTLVDIEKLRQFVKTSKINPILGSGLTLNNLSDVFPLISGAIVGSSIKITDLSSPIDIEKAGALARKWNVEKDSGGGV